MKVLVTGGTGFTGKALVRRLLDAGHDVETTSYPLWTLDNGTVAMTGAHGPA